MTYWQHTGRPGGWQQVQVTTRYGDGRGLPAGPHLPHVATKRKRVLNVAITRPDGSRDVVPVRTLRTKDPR